MDGSTDQTPAADETLGTIEIGNGDVVIYDRDNPDAWLQSDSAIELGA
jgi:hypothetical protein